jgi:hypothetical protein
VSAALTDESDSSSLTPGPDTATTAGAVEFDSASLAATGSPQVSSVTNPASGPALTGTPDTGNPPILQAPPPSLELPPPTTTNVAPGPVVTGRVVTTLGLPVVDVRMCVYAFGQVVPSVAVDLDGAFHFDSLGPHAPGDWVLVAEECGDAVHTPYRSAGTQLRPSDLPATVTLIALRRNALFGSVFDQHEQPVSNACIFITSNDTNLPLSPTSTRADGSYGPIELIPDGSYTAEIRIGSCIGPALNPLIEGGNTFSFPDDPAHDNFQVQR